MMEQEFQNRFYHIKPTSEVEAYCSLEGVSPLFIYRTTEKKKIYQKLRYIGKSLMRLFRKWINPLKSLRVANPLSSPMSKPVKGNQQVKL